MREDGIAGRRKCPQLLKEAMKKTVIPETKTSTTTPLRWLGGKAKSAELIVSLFPQGINEYREPFVGGGSVFLHARSLNLANEYWINDKFQELIWFWQTVQQKYLCNKMQSELRSILNNGTAREALMHYELANSPSDVYEDAFYFFLRNRCSFSGATYSGGLSKDFGRFTESAIDRLSGMPLALQGARITAWDALNLIEMPGEDVFLFLDPPYPSANGAFYGRKGELHKFDHEAMSKLLRKTKHKFLLTYGDCKEIRDLYKWANKYTWSKKYGATNSGGNTVKDGAELFISNYELKLEV